MGRRRDAQTSSEVGVAPEAPETHPLAQDCEQARGGGRKVCVCRLDHSQTMKAKHRYSFGHFENPENPFLQPVSCGFV